MMAADSGNYCQGEHVARIIKRGEVKTETAKYTCGNCGSLIEFEKSDIQGDQRDGDYVKCPLEGCGSLINASILNWTGVR